ncbi:MAG: glycosyltransferase family 2 protein [Desulfobacteraceae bacterium]
MPKVSVVIPTYNRALLLKTAIQSVLDQNFHDFEIIVVDDASEDTTYQTVNGFKDNRLKYIYHEIQKGEAASRNTGITNASAQYIAFLDDDDEWLPEKLKLQIDLLENRLSKVGAVYTGFLFVNLHDKRILRQRIPTKRGDVFNEMLVTNVVGAPSTVLIKRQCIDRVGLFDEKLSYFVDYDFFLRIAKYFHFDYIERPLVKYHVHDTKLSNNIGIVYQGLTELIKKYRNNNASESPHNKFFSDAYLSAGANYCFSDNIKKGREALCRSIVLNPLELRAYFNLLLSLWGSKNYKKLKDLKDKLLLQSRL